MTEKISTGIDIDKALIEQNVTNLVATAIAKSLGNKEVLVTTAVKQVIASYVKNDGTPCGKDAYNAKPYLNYLADNCIHEVVMAQVKKAIEENREGFELAVKRGLSSPAFMESAASSFLNAVLSCSKGGWRMPLTVSFAKDDD